MKNKLLLVLLTIPLLTFTACDSDKKVEEVTKTDIQIEKAADIMAFGNLEGSFYSNEYLGLSVTIPEGWDIQSETENTELLEKGKDLVANEDKTVQSAIEASAETTAYLITAFKYDINNSKEDFNPSFTVVAEDLTGSSIEAGLDYLKATQSLLIQSGLDYKFEKDFDAKKIGGKAFATMESNLNYANLDVKQRYHSMVVDHFAISIIISYTGDEQLDDLLKVIDTVDFK